MSEETKAKKSVAMKKIGFVPVKAGDFETCSSAGKANKGKPKPARSENHGLNIALSNKTRKVVVIHGIEYHSMKFAMRQLKTSIVTIRKRCNDPDNKNYYFKET